MGALNALRTLPGGYRDQKEGVSNAPGWGLSQVGKIGAQAIRAYRNALGDALFPRLAISLENEIREGLRTPKREGLAEALQAYLLLYERGAADPQVLEEAALRIWPLAGADGAALRAHLQAGLEGGASEMRHRRDEAIIKEARQKRAPPKT